MICVECGIPVSSVFKQFSKGNIRLTKCDHCNNFADKYVEYDWMLIVLDLILHKPEVYRHIIFNRIPYHETGVDIHLLKLLPLYLIFDVYLKFSRGVVTQGYVWMNLFYTVISSVVEYIAFLCGIILGVRLYHSYFFKNTIIKYNYAMMAILLANFGKLLVIFMLVWEYDINLAALGIYVFVVTSNITSVKVFLESSTLYATIVVIIGIISRLFMSWFLSIQHPGFIFTSY